MQIFWYAMWSFDCENDSFGLSTVTSLPRQGIYIYLSEYYW